MVFDKQHKWNQWLYLAEHWYNTCFHSSLQCSPFQALYGYEPRGLPSLIRPKEVGTEAIGDEHRREQTIHMLRANLEKAQKRMKKYGDLKRSERQLKVGDWVYIKLQPYRQVSVPGHIHSKLNPKYYGPYEIIEKIGSVDYKLNFPVGTMIHPVLHVSQLKLKHGEGREVDSELPELGPDGELRIEPIQVLDRRVIKKKNEPVIQWLVQWYNRPIEAATWENYEELAVRYPNFILEGKNAFMGEVLSRENQDKGGDTGFEGLGAVRILELTQSNESVKFKPTEKLMVLKGAAMMCPAHNNDNGVKNPLVKGSSLIGGHVAGDQ